MRAAENRPDLFSPTGLAHGAAAAMLASLRDERKESSGPAGRWDVDDGRIRARIATWAAPIYWLLMFEPSDRINPSFERLIMRATVSGVLGRLGQVKAELEAMRGGMAPSTSDVAALVDWLGDCPGKGGGELDYGGAAGAVL